MVHTILWVVTTVVTIVVFLGLAIYVLTYNPRRSTSWLFVIFSLFIVITYLGSLLIIVRPPAPDLNAAFLLRVRWMAMTLSPAFYLHLLLFYFSLAWQRYRFWMLIPIYLLNGGLTLSILFTNLVIAGVIDQPAPHTMYPLPGPLLPFLIGFLLLQLLGGGVGLLLNYRNIRSPSLRHQILYLLIPTGLALASSVSDCLFLLVGVQFIPHELPDTLWVLAVLLYTWAVVRHGAFTGRLLPRRMFFYTVLVGVVSLTSLYFSFSMDRWLQDYLAFPYPLVTGLLLLVVVLGFPALHRWTTRHLDGWLFRTEQQEQLLAYHLAEALAQTPHLEQLQAELLDALCTVLNVRSGYIAFSSATLSPTMLIVQTVRGNLVQPGDHLARPVLWGKSAQLVTPLWPQAHLKPGWQDIALFCDLTIDETQAGLLAIGEKRDGTSFSSQEMGLCTELAKQLNVVGRMSSLREKRHSYLEAAHQQEQMLQQLDQEVVATTRRTLTTPTTPLEIRVLGPLRVCRNGQLVSEADWGSEKAKAMLAYLLWKSPQGVSREELSQALWPERSFEDTANVFHVTLHKLRRVLQPKGKQGQATNYILYDRGKYRFNTAAPYWLDINTFQELTTRSADLEAWRYAVDLYQGSYLEDMVWGLPCEAEIEQYRLEQLYADTLRRLAAQTNEREATYYLEKLSLVEPGDEAIHRTLILGYVGRGRTDLAQQQVKRWQQILAELDVETSPEMHALWETLGLKNGYLVS